jgi:3-oxoisoapionate kinase
MTAELPYLGWYGDDFTGAAAVMEVLEFAGYPSVLFLDPPDAAAMAQFPGRFGVGIAGDARTRTTDWMDKHLPGVFAALRATGVRILHYKACSTMDSSPAIGSIGRAAEIGLAAAPWVPLVFAAPELGRWQAFGNLFARAPGGVVRLDRHPTMRHHPITPMDEADIRLHLARQTDLPIGLVDLSAFGRGDGGPVLAQAVAAGARIVAFDIVDQVTLAATGRLLWQEATIRPLFAIGSQGVEYALAAAQPRVCTTPWAARTEQVLVVSGSASPDTARQVEVAEKQGFTGIRVRAEAAIDGRAWLEEADRIVAKALHVIQTGGSPILYTALGPDDPALRRAFAARQAAGLAPALANSQLAQGLGGVLARIAQQTKLPRVIIAGGDTSSHVTRALGVTALTATARIAPGAPLLTGHRPGLSPVEIVLKGGQMGAADFFISTRDGAAPPLT